MVFRRRDDEGFESASIWGMLTRPFRAVAGALMDLFATDDSLHVDQSILARGIGLLTLPFRLFGGFLVFMVQAWPPSRQGFAFLRGAPAIMVLGLFYGALLTSDFVHSEARQIDSAIGYMNYQIDNASDKPEYALMFAEKLVELKPDVPKHMYYLGLAKERVGERLKAFDIMSSIADVDQPGYPPAHVWLSQYYLRAEVDLDQDAREEIARKHLELAVQVSPDDQSAHLSLAQMYLDQAKRHEKGTPEYNAILESAIENLTSVANGELSVLRLQAVPRLVELQFELGQDAIGRRRLNNEIVMLKSLSEKRPEIIQIWYAMVRCAILLKDYDQAWEIVQNAIQLVEEQETKRQIVLLASMIFLKKSDDFQDMSDRNSYRNRINSLCEAIRLNPHDRVVYLKLLDFIGEKQLSNSQQTYGANNEELVQLLGPRLDFSKADKLWLNDSIIGCPAPGVIHALLGMREVSKGNVRDGEKHWRMAEQQFDKTQIVVNNLIDVAAKERVDEFSNVLDMITLGIELFPDQPVFYQTRGVYLKNQGKFKEAISDLVYASEQLPQLVSLRKYLISCYEQIGDEQSVLEQKILLQQTLDSLDAADRKRVEASIESIN